MFTTSPDTSPPAQPPIKQLEFATAHSEQESADHCRLLPPSKGQFLCGPFQPMGDPVQQGQSSQWVRANGPRQGRGVEGGQGTGHRGGTQRPYVQPPCSPTCPAPLNTVGGGGSWTWQVCPSPQEALLEGGCPG